MPVIEINEFQGMNARIAKEKLPVVLFPKIVNLEMTQIEGYLRTRKGYKNIITSGLTALSNMTEFVDKNGTREIVLLDGSTLKRIPYSAGYGAVAAITNDERTAGATINTFKPVNKYSELRSGAGVNAATDYPMWYGYIKERDRFNGAETISADDYLDEQYNKDALANLTTLPYTTGFGKGAFGATAHASRATGLGLDESYYALYAAPVFDGYQIGFPQFINSLKIGSSSPTYGSMEIYIWVADVADALKSKRITHIDLFIAESATDVRGQFDSVPAYFLERIDLNSDTDHFLEKTGTVDNGTSKVTIADYADWLTFDSLGMFLYNVEDDEYYRITTETVNGSDMEFTVTPAPTNSASKTVRFINRWRSETISSVDYYVMRTFYDGYYKKLGSEMYEYLGIPTGDEGISDFRYKYGVIAGRRFFAVGFPDRQYGHYSVPYNYDIIPAQNRFPVKRDAMGIVDLADESVLIFYKDRAERVTVYDNTQYRIDEDFLNIGCTNHDSICKINDNIIALMDYKAPALLINGQPVEGFAEPLRDWWDNQLSDTVKEGCITSYNRLRDQIWFSFPDYSTSPYTTGIVFCFDLLAWTQRKVSAWFIIKTDKAIAAATIADDLHLLTSTGTQIQDWNNASQDEAVQGTLRLKLFQNRRFTQRINIERIEADFADSGANSLTIGMYLDESGTASATLTITAANREALLEYAANTVEFEISTASGSQQTDLLTILLYYSELGAI